MKTSPIEAKICGLNDVASIDAAVANGASYVGLMFYPPSPRAVTPEQARELSSHIPAAVKKVGVFVDPDDELLQSVLAQVPLDLIQLHGSESPDRVGAIKTLTGLPVLKAIKVANASDLDGAGVYDGVADMLLFDAKAPKDLADALPGGNGLVFDWNLLSHRQWQQPWMLSGGLDAGNVVQAVGIAGACAVDVSSGVEHAPGVKDPAAIKAFLDAVKAL
ncbi:MAG: phosphoribosylanthranilate isomerase [Rhodospirillaceae bacterium]|jgi:phosphoribosylanthranilate isomerase|nr:phosphoribosylanthranilate isomerase [Rhodospirillaceae bacterium]MBT3492934.1 phosphoribosylanthranilate isomerase [Rhodospirillaceae bacterium]MBT3780510.1 phosphoribosylanthranilate isomerase [Rhodospirillaceae bacterium]MBT3977294.1 phosphoribosylanthranilate isomerase [Rhodospirillaceae bacterium]MBT4168903.1 phosphoribosylanthranilate isomerase [Rhodospirillaceae bacterium]